ncbi:hypothetical protein [Paracoccus sp. S3-43]|uniref:hypothetical protein n=1 Tax=Paracoccus sp. S3-43 TaxID=3030011 RepID=UPI0023AEF891|nr:hypothetical protein [Paracoccus sp. S3-43]WEF26058.1 hypothetical protein PXD02_01765 [Paracoccus sp. S3-43]
MLDGDVAQQRAEREILQPRNNPSTVHDIAGNVNVSSMRPEGPAPLAARDLPHVSGGRSEAGCIIGDLKITLPSQQQK